MITPLIKHSQRIFLFILISMPQWLAAQNPLETYIEIGIKNNLVLQQKNIALEKALYSLKSANSLFLPNIGLKADYQSGQGGRSIGIPVGDMLNPVYSTLNQLTSSNSFQPINNVETTFFPQNFYDLKVRTAVPLINSDLIYNRQIQKQQANLKELDIEIYKNELVKNIRVAYYNYLSSVKAISIYESALNLAYEGKRINESLLRNGKSLKAYVMRSESEIQNLEAQKNAAILQSDNAKRYFNFLLNDSNNQTIDTTNASIMDQNKLNQYLLSNAGINQRTELSALSQSQAVYENVLKMNKAYWYPKINGFVDLGSQASNWEFNSKSRYYFVGVALDIPLFAGGKNLYTIKQTQLDLKNQAIQTSNIKNQIQLSANMAQNELKTDYQNYQSNLKQLESAKEYNRLIEVGYKEGVNSFIESIDARNQLTMSSLQVVISQYKFMTSMAIYEREISK